MADYIGRTRTNYFRVNSLEKLQDILNRCAVSGINADGITLITPDDKKPTAESLVGFYCYGTVEGYPIPGPNSDPDTDVDDNEDSYEDCDEYNLDAFLKDLSDCIAPGDACIIMETGFTNMRHLYGGATVVTHDTKPKYLDLNRIAQKTARKKLKNPDWKTQTEC